jgi:hypothetical protein
MSYNISKTDQNVFFLQKSQYSETSKPASTGTKKYGRFKGVAGFLRLLLQRIVPQGLKNRPMFRENLFSEGPV